MRHLAPLPGGPVRSLLLIVFCGTLLGGCATPAQREAAAEARGYERGYQQAVQEQYWIIQQQQRRSAAAQPPKP